MEKANELLYAALDNGYFPDIVVRRAIRYLNNQRLAEIRQASLESAVQHKWDYIENSGKPKCEMGRGRTTSFTSCNLTSGDRTELKTSEVAIEQETANQQHYEVSTAFIQSCLGPHMKYSCCLYPTGKETLAQAEELMLELYCERAKLEDGMQVLDLGCGWGSLSLFLAKKYPRSRITSLSNSKTQKLYIDSQAGLRGLGNLEVFTGDVKEFDFAGKRSFDRIISIEMFEHMKNYEALLAKISTWLKPNKQAKGKDGALLFVHIFCHKTTPYHFESNDGWMSQNFFSGGTMPCFDLFTHFQRDLTLRHSWFINGTHYGRTSEDWLKKLTAASGKWVGKNKEGGALDRTPKAAEMPSSPRSANGDRKSVEEDRRERDVEEEKTYYKFRTFFLACAEFFAASNGEEWGVGHYLFQGGA